MKRSDFTPWLHFWLSPHKTTRKLIDNPVGHGIISQVAIFYGLQYALEKSVSKLPFARESLLNFALLAAFGVVLSFLGLYVSGWCFKVAGGWFGGTGKSSDLRIAVALSWVPLCLCVPIDIFTLAFLVSHDIQGVVGVEIIRQYPSLQIAFLLRLVSLLLSFGYSIPTLSAAHRFSKVKAVVTLASGLLLLFLVFAALVLPFFLASR